MKTTFALLFCLILGSLFPLLGDNPRANLSSSEEAYELLKLSQTQNQTNHPLAVQTAQEALALFQSANDSIGTAKTYAHLGRCYYAQNTMSESAHYYDLALQIWRQGHNTQADAN